MATVFTRIMRGELPGRFVYEDERCAVFLTIEPLRPGHVMVVPREEVDHWLDLDPELLTHLMVVAQRVGRAIHREFGSEKVGLMIVGLEVPHVHIHLSPIDAIGDMNFANADRDPDPDRLDRVAERLRRALADDAPGA
jgi:histidine triad (HIT) family protein